MGIDTSMYQNLRGVEMPSMVDSVQKSMTLSQMAAQQDHLAKQSKREDETYAHEEKLRKAIEFGNALDSYVGLPPEQRAAIYPKMREDLVKSGTISPDVLTEQEDPSLIGRLHSNWKQSSEGIQKQLHLAQIKKLEADAQTEPELRRLGLEKLRAETAKLRAEAGKASHPANNLPKDKLEQVDAMGKKQASVVAINNEIKAAYEQLSNPNLSEDDKIKVGQGLLKTLNSTQGSDAVGAEEAKRLGSYLEYKIGNLTGPGSFIGRDLDQFARQVGLTSQKLDRTALLNDQAIRDIYKGGTGQTASIDLDSASRKNAGTGGVVKEAKAAKQWDSVHTNPMYFKAMKFLKENPNDPDAKAIVEKLGGGA